MPINAMPILINDGGSTKKPSSSGSSSKKTSTSSAKKQIEAGRNRRKFNQTTTAAQKAEPERVTLPTWTQIKAGRARREFNNTVPGVTASKLNASKELADTRANTWKKLSSIHEEKQIRLEASKEKLENYRNQSGFKYLANDYETKINRANQALSNYQANPSTFNANQFNAALRDLQRWENDHKRDLDKYSQLTDDYNTAAREYNRSAESLNRYAPAAQRAEENYTTLFGNFDWSNQGGLSASVKKDYQNVLTAQNQAKQQMKKDLETQRDQLQSQIEAMSRAAKNSIDRGTGNANLQLQQLRQLNEQLQTVESNLATLQEQEEAQKLEELAKNDPQFKSDAKKGEQLVDEYLRIIMNSGNLDSYEEYNAMTDEQKEIYSYYMYTDPEKANAYKQGISREINQTLATRRQNLMEQSIEENPTLAGLSTIITRPFTTGRIAAEALASLGQDGNRIADPNTRGQAQLRAEETARQASLEQTNNPVLQTLGQAGYAIADMAPALAANAYLPGAGTAYMGLMGGASGYADAASRGLTNQQALTFGATSAVVSTALEKIGLDKIGAAFAGGKKPATQLLRQVLGSFLAEGSEEAAEQVAQTIYDELISGTKSARNQAVQQYMNQGMSRQQAERKAWEDIGSDTLQSFIVGGIAGGAMSGAAGVVNNATDSRLSQNLQQFGLTKEEADSLVKAQRPARQYSAQEPVNTERVQPVNTEVQNKISQLSNDIGVTTVFDDTLASTENGYYDTQTGEIHINPNADSVNTVFSHELTHSLENTQAYQKLKDLVLNELGDEAETLRQQKTELYNKLGKELDVDSELVADYISQNLFTDEDSIRRVAETDRSLATRIKNWITRMIAKVTGNSEKAFLKRAEGLYSQALQEASQGREAVSLKSTQQTELNSQEGYSESATARENTNLAGAQERTAAAEIELQNEGTPAMRVEDPMSQSELSAEQYQALDSTDARPTQRLTQKTNQPKQTREPREGNTRYQQMVDEYGSFPEGEAPRERDVQVPRSTNGKDRVSRFTRTEMEAKATPDELIKNFEDGVANGVFSYQPSKQRDKLEKQIQYIQDYGYQDALNQWKGAVKRGTVNEDDMLLGQVLYAEAAKAGDAATALKLAAELAAEGTRLGQAVSSMRMLKKLTPEGKLYYAQQSIENLKRDLKKTLGDKAPDIKINDDLAQKLMDAKTQEEIDKATTELYTDIANQMPNTWMDKWDAWRYLAMLGNPKTHIRNIVGNVLFGNRILSLRGLKNKIGAVTEAGVDRLNRLMGGQGIERTKSLTTRNVDRAFARNDFKNMKGVVQGGGKYNSVTGIKAMKTNPFSGGVIGKTRLDKPLNALAKLNSAALEAEDTFFLKGAYIDSMAQYMKANKLSPEDMTGSTLEKARTYAIREAQKATFRDASALASQLNNFASSGGKARRVIVSGLVPFSKTPANIVKRGVEYSPIGLLNGVKQAAYDVRKGNKTAAEAIDSIATGLTGSGVLALGMWLASQGLVIGGDDDNTKKRNFDEMTGSQSYALDLSPLGIPYTYTLDWAAPTALPLFVGVEMWNAIQEYGEGTLDFSTVVEAIANITEPVFNLTMLDGINSAIQTAAYDQATAVTSILTSAATDYFTQGVPTLLGQINRSFFDNTRRTSYVENDSPLPDFLSRAIQSAQMKVPGLSNQMNPYQDAFGRIEENGSWWENFFSPGYLEKKSTSPAEAAIESLYNATGDASVLPSKPQKSITVNGETIYLTAQQYTQYVQERGQMSLDALNHLVESSIYKNMDDNTKVKAVQDVYKYADALAKANLSDYEPDNWVNDVKGLVDKGVSIADAISFKAKTSDANTAEKADVLLSMGLSAEDERAIYETFASDSRKEDMDSLLGAGVSMDQILQAQSMYSTIYGKDEKASLKASEFSKWLDEQDWDASQKEALRDSFLYFTMSPVDSTNYDKLTEAGLSEDAAYGIGSLLAELKPEEGKDSITNSQKYLAIAQSSFSDDEKLKAFSAIMEEGTYNKFKSSLELGGSMQAYAQIMSDISHLKPESGKNSVSDYQKYMAAAGSDFSEEERMAVLGTLMSDSQYSGLQRAVMAGADLETYTDLLHMTATLEPIEGETSVSNNEKYLAVVNSNYTDDEKLATLYGMMDVKAYSELEESLDAGIGMGDHFQFKIAYSKIEADKDENGESVSRGMGTKQSKVNAYINSLPLTSEQKDALYLSEYTAANLDKTPWHGGELYQGDVFSAGASKRNEVVEGFSKSRITQMYGNDGHSGTDISHLGSDPYPPIYNTEDGVVTWVQTGHGNAQGSTGNDSYGNLVQVTFSDGRSAIYAHLSDVLVKEGDSVKAGQQIGNMGNTGNSYGNHLHFELHDANGNTMDSTAYLLGEASSSSGGKSGSGDSSGSSGSSGSSRKKPAYSTSSFGQINLSTGRRGATTTRMSTTRRSVPQASAVSSSSRARSISLPAVRSISKSALSGSTSNTTAHSSGGIQSRVSRESGDVRFIKL